jgi:hypothetical protein
LPTASIALGKMKRSPFGLAGFKKYEIATAGRDLARRLHPISATGLGHAQFHSGQAKNQQPTPPPGITINTSLRKPDWKAANKSGGESLSVTIVGAGGIQSEQTCACIAPLFQRHGL